MNKQSKTQQSWKLKLALAIAAAIVTAFIANSFLVTDQTFAQAGRKSSEKQKKNPNASGDPDDPQKQETKIEKSIPPASISISTDVVNVEAVVYNKKTGGILQGLKKEHFEIYEDGVKQEIENFATPEAPVTMVLMLEYSKLVDLLGLGTGGMFEPGRVEILRPAYEFVNRFVQPKDFISIVAYDIRPTPLVDFTDDKGKLMQAVNLLIRNNPAFSESNLFDAMKFVLRGGVGDAVVLEDSKSEKAEYAGLYEVNARTAILLVSSGLDTFSKINFDEARKIVENSGVPIYVISTGNMFLKRFDTGRTLDPGTGGILYNGIQIDRMVLLQAQNTLKTFSDSTGGKYFPVTFPGEIPSVLQSIQALVRNQYSLGYTPNNSRKEGKRRKIKVKVNLGDQIDPKLIVIQHRQSYIEAKEKK
ncbi:MAG: VWA domain-containing protein [Acidobacteria bacterium]|nr:VWA domain-containing protein [Acidobacteriota bacterium]